MPLPPLSLADGSCLPDLTLPRAYDLAGGAQAFLREQMRRAIKADDPDLTGELLDCLKCLGEGGSDEARRAERFLMVRDRPCHARRRGPRQRALEHVEKSRCCPSC